MNAKKATPAVIAVLRQATAIKPTRNKLSDGLLTSAAHMKASPTSDHNTGYAVDLTHDPKNGINCVEIFEKLKCMSRKDIAYFKSQVFQPFLEKIDFEKSILDM